MEYVGYLAALAMGISLGMIGGGGSILTVPILVYLFSQDPLDATTGSLLVVGLTALAGAVLAARKKLIEYKMGLTFAVPSFVGVFIARHFVLPVLPDVIVSVGGVTLTKSTLVMAAFALLMVLASRAMIRSGIASAPVVPEMPANVFRVATNGFLVGLTTGFVGAGGGFLIIPALVILLKLPMKKAVSTSLAIIAANSLFGYAISASTRQLDLRLLAIISIIGVAGLFVGQSFGTKVDEKSLKKGFGAFVLLVGTAVLLDQIRRLY